jgi:hypothetical protein
MAVKKKSLIGEAGVHSTQLSGQPQALHHKARVSPPTPPGDAGAMLTVAGKKIALAKLATAKLATAKLSTTKSVKN